MLSWGHEPATLPRVRRPDRLRGWKAYPRLLRDGGARPEFKADDTPVTVADREAERLIRQRIAARYPKHAVLGEEYGGGRRV